MAVTSFPPILLCPVCHSHLYEDGQNSMVIRCIHNHSFDVAREGYVHLLLKKHTGDTKEMVLARKAFLEQGYYDPLVEALHQLILAYLQEQEQQYATTRYILDVGCGEGYFPGKLHRLLAEPEIENRWIGVDISKDAIRMAARAYKDIRFVVADVKEKLPFADDSIQILVNIFAPRNPAEFARIVAPGGLLLIVIPAIGHLLSLRTTLNLMSIEEQKQQRVIEQFHHTFRLRTTTPVEYKLRLKNEAIRQIVAMTPNYWHPSREREEHIQQIEQLDTSGGFLCLAFQRLA